MVMGKPEFMQAGSAVLTAGDPSKALPLLDSPPGPRAARTPGRVPTSEPGYCPRAVRPTPSKPAKAGLAQEDAQGRGSRWPGSGEAGV